MTNLVSSRRVVATVATILTASAVLVVPAASTHAAPAAPCGPLGTLVALDLNDRCDFGSGLDPSKIDASTIVASLSQAGLFATTVPCANGTVAAVVAKPDELLVTAGRPGQLAEGLSALRIRLGTAFVGVLPVNGLAAVVKVQVGTINDQFLRVTVPQLQGATWSADLNYLEPAQPNNGFSPGGDPTDAAPAASGTGGAGRVLVIDSPAQPGAHPVAPDVVTSTLGPTTIYDVDGNGLVDEDHGHGVFVASLVKRLAPTADVWLAGVQGGQLPRVTRWSPMLFSDADLVATMGAAFGLSPSGLSARRTFDVVNLSLGGAGCDGVASRLGLGRFMRDLAVVASQRGPAPTYVAAAGNDGGDVKHFPAAFRDVDTMKQAAHAIELAVGPAAADAVVDIHEYLATSTVAVGSWNEGVRDGFSNCGEWVNGVAAGADQVSRYVSASTWASWSGTSFATPRMTAALVGAVDVRDAAIREGLGAC